MSTKAPRNRTITLLEDEKRNFYNNLLKVNSSASTEQILNKVINQDVFEVAEFLPSKFVDLLFIEKDSP